MSILFVLRCILQTITCSCHTHAHTHSHQNAVSAMWKQSPNNIIVSYSSFCCFLPGYKRWNNASL